MSMKELEEEKKDLKEKQQRNVSQHGEDLINLFKLSSQDDIALVVCMITILAFTCFVVIFKVSVEKDFQTVVEIFGFHCFTPDLNLI